MKIKIITVQKKITEEKFPEYMKKEGYKIKKLKNRNVHKFSKMLGEKIDSSAGLPDFFVWNKKERFLCEFKSKNDSWRISQMMWAVRNYKIPLALALATENSIEISEEMELDTEFNEMMDIINFAWKIRDIYLNEFVEKHKEVIGKKLFINKNGGYFGQIPLEVSEKWKKFDEVYYKDKQKQKRIIRAYKENKIKVSQDIALLL